MITEGIQLVEVWGDDGAPVAPLSTKSYFGSERLYMPEAFAPPTGKHIATVRREVSETIGGPGFSSVRVSTSIEVHCDHSTESIHAAAEAALGECVILNEEAVLNAYDGLLAHRRTLKLSEG